MNDDATRDLLVRAAQGEALARDRLLERHRSRLRRMVELRLDPRVAPRVDASDVVQEALVEAAGRLSEYTREPPVPFYPWLRRLAWERLVKMHRFHLHAQRRSVSREEPEQVVLPEESAALLAERFVSPGTSPSRQAVRHEQRARVRAALADLAPSDREILVMRYLEEMSNGEIAATLGLGESAVKMRHRRALERLVQHLGGDASGGRA